MDIEAQIAELRELPYPELAARYEAAFGEPPRIVHPSWVWRRLAWHVQAQEFGGLSEDAQRRLDVLMREIAFGNGAADRTLRTRFVRGDGRKRLPVGSAVEREWKGRRIRVYVVEGGFEWDGLLYKSLSAVARAVTGTPWNGWAFFGLRERKRG